MKHAWLIITGICFAAAAGCTHVQLRNDTVNESAAVGDMITQEVMNNLAMFVYDPNSMPYFSFPNQGSSSVTDQGTVGVSAGWGRPITSGESAGATTPSFTPKHFADLLLASIGLTGSAQRSNLEGVTLTPVLDPRKLELMRCAYQKAVSSCGGPAMKQLCPDCQARFNTFYTGNPAGDIGRTGPSGIVSSNCLAGPNGPCWFHIGDEKCVPKHCECIYVGCYCGVYVWVDHAGRDELSKLTLAILDYAQNNPPVLATKTVTYNIDQFGLPATRNDSVGTITATIGVDEQPPSLLHIPEADAAQIRQTLIQRRQALLDEQVSLQNKPGASDQIRANDNELGSIQQKLQFLQEQLRAGGLREQYIPGPAAQTPPGLLQLQLYQNSLFPPQQ